MRADRGYPVLKPDGSRQRGPLRRIFALLLTAALALPATAVFASDEFVRERTFFLGRIQDKRVRLEGFVIKRADLSGRLPVALVAHGMSTNVAEMLDLRGADFSGPARDLARRGYLAAVVMRRGYGQSDGPASTTAPCAPDMLAQVLAADADDLQVALDALSRRPDVDSERAIVVGVSTGAAAAIALSARNPRNLKGVVAVSGGLRLPDCTKDEELVAAYRSFGSSSRVPSLWIYARNDSVFGPALVESLQGAFLDGGGDVKLVMFEPFGNDGHNLFASAAGRLKWLIETDAFLRFHALPATRRDIVTDLMKQLRLEERNRAFLEGYLAAPTFKAMARTADASGHSTQYGAASLDVAIKAVLEGCKEGHKSKEPCLLVMANDTFVGDKPAPPPVGDKPAPPSGE